MPSSSYRDNPDPGFRGSATDYRDRLEPAVAATEPAPAPAYRSVEAEAMFSIAISLKRIADSLGQLVAARPLTTLLDTHGPEAIAAALHDLAPAPGDNPWIDWPGGECPVPDVTLVDVRFRTGEVVNDEPAGVWRWAGEGPYTVAAYRLHKEPTK